MKTHVGRLLAKLHRADRVRPSSSPTRPAWCSAADSAATRGAVGARRSTLGRRGRSSESRPWTTANEPRDFGRRRVPLISAAPAASGSERRGTFRRHDANVPTQGATGSDPVVPTAVPTAGDHPPRTGFRRHRALVKVYGSGDTAVRALDGVSVDFAARRVHRDHGPVRVRQVHADALPGRAGHGRPPGRCCSASTELTALGDDELTRLRRDRVGFVFQSFNLLPDADRRAEHPAAARAGRPPAATGEWFDTLVETLGLARPADAPARRALRRPAAAGRHRPGADHPARRRVRRRADRQPGLAHRRRGARASCAPASASSGRPSSWSPTTRSRRPTPTGWCCSPTAGSPARSPSRPPTSCSTAMRKLGA